MIAQNIDKTPKWLVIILLSFVSLGVFTFYFFIQKSVDYAHCSLCDGIRYQKIYEYFRGIHHTYQIESPFHQRGLVPFMAALFPLKNMQDNFLIIHVIFSVLAVNLLYFLWQSLKIPFHLRVIALAWLLLHWTGLIRLNLYDPLTVDIPLYGFQALLMILILKRAYVWLPLLAPLATWQKESFLALLIALCFSEALLHYQGIQRLSKKNWIYLSAALLLSLVTLLGYNVYFPPHDTIYKNAIITLLFFAKETLESPLDLVRWMVALFTAYGAFMLLALQRLKTETWKIPEFHYLGFFSGMYLLFGILAGRDMTRILFLGFPFIMTWILLLLKSESIFQMGLAVLLSIPLMRLVSNIPDQSQDWESYAQWYPAYADLGVVSAWGIYLVMSYWLLMYTRQYFRQ